MHAPAHRAASEHDFDSYFAREIEPALAELEAHRKKKIRLIIILAAFGAAGFGGVALLAQSAMLDSAVAMAAFAAGFGGFLSAGLIYFGLANRYKQVLTGGVCAYLGLDYTLKRFDFPLARFKPLLPFFSSAKLEDRMGGRIGGVDVVLCEGKFSKKEAKWRAVMLMFSFDTAFRGETVVVANTHWVGNFIEQLRQSGSHVPLDDPRFGDRFSVFSTDEDEARSLLTPRFMERVMELTEHLNNTRGVALAFSDSQLLMTVRLGSVARRFEIGNVFREVRDGERRAHAVRAELERITDIIEILDLTRLPSKEDRPETGS